MKQDTERLDMEIDGLQAEIRLHNETKDAWDTILRNAANDSFAAYRAFANTEAQRLNSQIEAIQEEIQHHIKTRDAWETVAHHTERQPRIFQNVTYVKGEEVQWHLQRLDKEIESLQEEIRFHEETKEAWKTILCDTKSEMLSVCPELANSETARLDREIEAVQAKIQRHLETRSAWDTILRNAASESRVYQGATYMRGLDGQWHRQQAEPVESYIKDDNGWTASAVSRNESVWQALLNACDKTLLGPRKESSLPAHGKEQFQSLGLQ
jgi:hypothetical protein